MKTIRQISLLVVVLSLFQRSISFTAQPRKPSIESVSQMTATASESSNGGGQPLLVSFCERLDCDLSKPEAPVLILASQSPRRREILDMMGLSEGKEYLVEPSPLDESKLQVELANEKLSPVEYTRRLAEAKALALAEAHAASKDEEHNSPKIRYYLGSDTIVEIDDSILEKPKDQEDAKRMLTTMSGRKHRVHTGVALYRLESNQEKPALMDSFTDTACVQFTDITNDDMDAYIRSGEPMDKAGSYGIQGIGGQFVKDISGDFFTVMGLPMHKTSKLVAKALQAESVSADSTTTTRRQMLMSSATLTTAATLLSSSAANAARAKGAAELDLEFYVRDLVSGNKKEGSIAPSKNGPPVPPPRTLKGPIIAMLLNNECTADCITIRALVEELQEQDKAAGRSIRSEETIVKDIQLRVDDIRERTKNSFFTKAPWKKEDISDQYYFDFTMYALWKTAAQLIENTVNRDRFVRNLGRLLVSKLAKDGVLNASLLVKQDKENVLVGSIPAITELLNLFKSSQYCKNYRIRSSDNAGVGGDDVPIFDKFDDESLASIGQVNALVSVYEPATLGASLQINGENSRFAPDFVGTSLAAVWEICGGIRTTWDTFFVDPEYRPNPKDYFPNEQLFQMTLNKG